MCCGGIRALSSGLQQVLKNAGLGGPTEKSSTHGRSRSAVSRPLTRLCLASAQVEAMTNSSLSFSPCTASNMGCVSRYVNTRYISISGFYLVLVVGFWDENLSSPIVGVAPHPIDGRVSLVHYWVAIRARLSSCIGLLYHFTLLLHCMRAVSCSCSTAPHGNRPPMLEAPHASPTAS